MTEDGLGTLKSTLKSKAPAKVVLTQSDVETMKKILGDSFLSAANNIAVLKCAQDYLALRNHFEAEVVRRSQIKQAFVCQDNDLTRVENGVNVLCAVCAHQMNNAALRQDVVGELNRLSGFYQRKVAEAYVSASIVVLDGEELSRQPSVLKKLVANRDSLQQLHYHWPSDKDESNLQAFYAKVDSYARLLNGESCLYPEKKSSFINNLPQNIAINQRTA